MDAQEAAHAFAALFPTVYRRFYRRIPPTAYQLTSESFAVLQHLADTGPLTVTEAARHFARSQAAMSEIFKRLVERDLLDRMVDERDRRRTLIWLTSHGRDTLRTSREVLSEELLTKALQRMPVSKRRALIESVEMLLETPTRDGAIANE